MGLLSLFKSINSEDREILGSLKNVISLKRIKLIKQLLKQEKISLEIEKMETSIAGYIEFPRINSKTDDVDVSDVNEDIKKAFEEKLFRRFADEAFEKITSLIASNIVGLNSVKKQLQYNYSQCNRFICYY